jgi:hypothetical protein
MRRAVKTKQSEEAQKEEEKSPLMLVEFPPTPTLDETEEAFNERRVD